MDRAMMRMTCACLLITATVCAAGADNWERFRGPNGAGVSGDKGVPLTFGTSENVVWKVELPGSGNSSPIIWGKRLFLHTAGKDGASRSLLCLDTADGKIVWQKTIPGDRVTIRKDSSLASSTPTTDGHAVYVSFWNGKDVLLEAYDFDGMKLWSKNLGTFNSQHGAGASPILYKDKLILANDMDKDDFTTKVPNERPSFLMALDKRTGKLIWETARVAERACYSAPLLRQRPGSTEAELILESTTAVTGYDPDTGAKRWEASGWQQGVKGPLRTVASPVLLGDILCVCSGGDLGRYAVGLELSDLGKPQTPKVLWENRKDFPYISSPLAHGDHFYTVNDAGYAGCWEARTGKRVWFERLSESAVYASPLLIDGKIYVASSSGDVYVIAAEPTYRLLAHNELAETIRATGAVAGDRLYLRGEHHLYCIGTSPKR
jgi:outer membrane protein assembly factor BamB